MNWRMWLGVVLIGCAMGAVNVALLHCGRPLPKPESVTLLRVDGGFMSCTTFLSAPPDGGP